MNRHAQVKTRPALKHGFKAGLVLTTSLVVLTKFDKRRRSVASIFAVYQAFPVKAYYS
jgi:hypothetical protein